MVNAELSHNPFLLETKVLFNGHEPLVNSAIDRYRHVPLVTWVDKVPQIFHDEMNGYGFDLFFSGTDADFASVKEAFEHAGVSDESVRILRKGSLGSPLEKLGQLLSLVKWLKEHRNAHLEYEMVIEENPNLTDASFSMFLLHGKPGLASRPRLTLELIEDVADLEGTDLTLAPIVISVTPESVGWVSDDVRYLLDRPDVATRQLFFTVHRILDRERVARVLSDLGARDPQVVDGIDDPRVVEYVRNNLVAEYVRDSIRILDAEVHRISGELQEEASRGERYSMMKEERIGAIEAEIARLNEADDVLASLSAANAPREFENSRQSLRRSIMEWNNRKRQVQGEARGRDMAEDLQRAVENAFRESNGALSVAAGEACRQMDAELRVIYREAGVDVGFAPFESPMAFPPAPHLVPMAEDLLSLGEKSVVTQRHDFFGLFGIPSESSGEGVEVTTYYLDIWRKRALEHTGPVLDQMCDAYLQALRSYQQWSIESYRSHIRELVASKVDKKDQMVAMLSEDEMAMRSDSDWLGEFKSQLQEVKRG